jgi:hypothetical protein
VITLDDLSGTWRKSDYSGMDADSDCVEVTVLDGGDSEKLPG